MLCFLDRRVTSNDFKSEISTKSIAESCSRQIRAWADHLQNSEIQGQRHLNDKTSKSFQQKKDQADFFKELQQYLPEELRGKKA